VGCRTVDVTDLEIATAATTEAGERTTLVISGVKAQQPDVLRVVNLHFIKTTKQIKQYVGRTYTKFPAEFMQAIDDLQLTDPEVPECPDSYQDVFAMEEWKMDLKDYRVKAVEYTAF